MLLDRFRYKKFVATVASVALLSGISVAADRSSPLPRSASTKSRGAQIVRTALSFRGARYRYGGSSSRGFDCSGFTKYLYGKGAGVGLPHSAAQQFQVGKKVSLKNIQPGDLLFFSSRGRRVGHVGVYAGNGKMVHAANPRRGVTVDSALTGYWSHRLAGIRRPKT